MRTASTTLPRITAELVRDTVAEFLGMDPVRIDPHTSLTAYGIDSLGALELVASLEDRFACSLPESLLTDCPDLDRLTGVLAWPAGTSGPVVGAAPASARDRMIADSRLPADIRPSSARAHPPGPRRVLLTGATGFLGASLLRTFIDAGDHVVCLVRLTVDRGQAPVPRPQAPGLVQARVRENLERYGLWRPGDEAHIDVIAGDIERPLLGLAAEIYDRLAEEVDVVCHAAADVNWVSSYDALRQANVEATTTLLRFACSSAPKQFQFVSSLSVCFADDGPPEVSEDTDMLCDVDRLPLGYAQSKCVAESLVREAAARGLAAQIIRPALLAGHSLSGASNVDDLIAALLKGCIQMGAAPDLDWAFDAVPVDTAAEAIVRLGRASSTGLETFHLRHPRPRHWRECVLWANVFGYSIRLEPYASWLDRLMREARTADHALYRLRSFFTRRVGGRTVPQLYQEHVRSRVTCDRSRARERSEALAYPPLDADRLDAYFRDFIARGFLEAPRTLRRPALARRSAASLPHTCFERALQRHFADEGLRVGQVEIVSSGSEHSIVSELTSWRHGARTGLFHCRVHALSGARPHVLDMMAKIKPPDDDVLDVAETTAAVCDARVARELARFRDRIGIRGARVRELEIYGLQSDARFARHMPRCYGAWHAGETDGRAPGSRHESSGLLLERLSDMAVLDASHDVSAWTDAHIAAAIDGIAEVHAAWLGREAELASRSWIGHVQGKAGAAEMAPLWDALASHAAPAFGEWAGPSLLRAHAEIVDTVTDWWPAFDALPRTLIHNDFNSRNIGIRRTPDGPRLAAYDWEMATIGAPQRDLAELLCFVLPPDVTPGVLDRWIERHRAQLARHSGTELSSALWREGFRSALNDLLMTRLAFYALIHRVRPQSFLPRVVSTWLQLHRLSAER